MLAIFSVFLKISFVTTNPLFVAYMVAFRLTDLFKVAVNITDYTEMQ